MAIQVKKWDSGLRVIEPEVYLATGLEDIFGEVQSQIGDKEFSILLKGDWNDLDIHIEKEMGHRVPLDTFTNMYNKITHGAQSIH